MSQNGKGSKRRPKSIDQKTWDDNYDRIFRKKEPKNVNRRKSSD